MEPIMISGIPFITEDGIRLDSVAIVYFSVNLSIEERIEVYPLFATEDIGNRFFRLRNLVDNEYRHVNVADDGVKLSLTFDEVKLSLYDKDGNQLSDDALQPYIEGYGT